IRLSDGSFDSALAAVIPIVDGCVASADFTRAAGFLQPILNAEAIHRGTLQKMAEVREAEGNVGEAARMRFALGQEEEGRGDPASAVESYQRVVALVPGHAEALARLAELAPSAGLPQPPPPPEPLRGSELVAEIEEPLIAAAPPATPAGPPVSPAA